MPRRDEDFINEDEPLEERYTPAQPAFTSTGMQLEVRGKLFEGLDIGISNIVDDTTDERQINERLDMMRRIFERQRVVFEHRETMLMLANKRVMLRELPGMITDYTGKRAHEYAGQQARWQSSYLLNGKRGDFKMSNAQQSWAEQFNDETQKKLDEFKRMADEYPGEVKNLEERIRRCERVLAGLERTDLLLDLDPFDVDKAAE
jgi:selenocysteine-specific translation elongation factor